MQLISKDDVVTGQPSLVAKFLAEMGGTFVLVFCAAGAVMIENISEGFVTPLGSALAAGIAVMLMVYSIRYISGAHINPAVTFGFLVTRKIRFKDAVAYFIAQLSGAIFGAWMLRLIFGNVYGLGGHTPLGGVTQSLVIEIILTFFLMSVIMVVSINQNRFKNIAGLAIGAVVALGIILGGPISGGSMNPARSFGPAMVGWIWSYHWLYWVGPIIGATIGALFCNFLAKIIVSSDLRIDNPDSD